MILFFAAKVLLFFETTKQIDKNIKYNSYFCLFWVKTEIYLQFLQPWMHLWESVNDKKKRGTRSVECRARKGDLWKGFVWFDFIKQTERARQEPEKSLETWCPIKRILQGFFVVFYKFSLQM